MKQDQNRIELRLNTAEYDECVLYANEGTRILPGSLLVFTDGNVSEDRDPIRPNRGYANFSYSAQNKVRVTESVPLTTLGPDDPEYSNAPHLLDAESPYKRFVLNSYLSSEESDFEAYEDSLGLDRGSYPRTITRDWNPDRFPCAVVIENGLFGKSLSHEQSADELVLCRYLNETNEVLLRAVPGIYYYGDIVYAVQTKNNGIWVCSEGTYGAGVAAGIIDTSVKYGENKDKDYGMKIGICQEDFRITPMMCRIVDNTGPEDPTGYTPADQDVSAVYAERYGASAIPTILYGEDGFYRSTASSSRYFAGAMLNLIKVRTTAFYAATAPLPEITGITISSTGRYRTYDGNEHPVIEQGSERGYFTVSGTQTGDDVSCVVKNMLYGTNPKLKDAATYTLQFKVVREGYRTYTKTETLTIAQKRLTAVTSVEDKQYDGTTSATVVIGAVSGIAAADRDNVTVTAIGRFRDASVGEDKVVDISYTVSSRNYVISDVTRTASILPRQNDGLPDIEGLELTAATDVSYTGQDQSVLDLISRNTQPDDVVSFSPSTVKDAGTYNIEVTVQRDGYKPYTETVALTVGKSEIVVSNVRGKDKVYDGTTTAEVEYTVTGIWDGFALDYDANFSSPDPGLRTVRVYFYIPEQYQDNYYFQIGSSMFGYDVAIPATILPQSGPDPSTGLPDLEGIELTGLSSVYTGLAQDVSSLVTVDGSEEGDVITFDQETVKDCGATTVTVTVVRDGYEPWTGTCVVTINKAPVTVSGTTVEDKDYDETTDATVVLGTVSGVVGDDDVVVIPSASFPSADPGTYTVRISYTLSGAAAGNYEAPANNAVRATIRQVEVAPTYTYAAVANGGPTETTTEIAVHFTASDPSTIPASIPYSKIQIGGDADLNTDAEECVGALGIFAIPVRMKKGAKDSYEITIKIDAGNEDINVKPVTAYFMSGYWGCYPCQLGDSTTPTADQITGMYGRHVLTGAKVDSVSCTFALDERDWSIEVQKNGITGEDADMEESGCGYEFFVTCWDDTTIGAITNEINIPQNAAFKPFTITINGIEYSGVVSKNCDLPSGTSPYTVNLT